jgi:hypothetical protein
MGILDDAIREHLELKRQSGADGDDLERLEKEAFGPPTRPGDPEFDTSEGQVVPEPSDAAAPETEASAATDTPAAPVESEGAAEAPAEAEGTPAAEPELSGGAGIFDAESDSGEGDWLASLEDVVEAPTIEDPPAVEETEARPAPEPAAEEAPVPEAPAEEPAAEDRGPDLGLPSTRPEDEITPAEQARLEHPNLGDTIAHEAIPEDAAPATDTGEQATAPPEAPESAIFDQDTGEGGEAEEEDFDLDLELDDEPEASAPPAAPVTDEGAPITDERAIEPEPTSTEMEALPPAAPAPSTDEFETGTGDFEVDEEEEDELEDEDEDLLEETPDFLQDAPEGERLWFEQGAPKDFDFDDDDD